MHLLCFCTKSFYINVCVNTRMSVHVIVLVNAFMVVPLTFVRRVYSSVFSS